MNLTDILGESSETLEQASYSLTGDGTYSFILKGKEAGLPELFTVIIQDTEAPVVTFEGVDDKGKAKKGSFSYSCDEENVSISIKKGNKAVNTLGNTVKGSGTYTVTAVDAAGNTSVYQIKAGVHLNMFSYILLVILAIIVGILIIFYSVNRDQMKVR